MRRHPLSTAIIAVLLSGLFASGTGHAIYGDTTVGDDPDSVFFVQVRSAMERKDWASAERMLDRRVIEFPEDADAWALLGYTRRSTDRLSAGLTAYELALRIDPRHIAALSYYGVGLLQAGQRDRAFAILAKIVAICGEECEAAAALSNAIAAGAPSATPPLKRSQ